MSFPADAFPWLLRQKATIPDPVAGLLHRPELEERALPTRRKLTVLRASGGFGKTTLMAQCCRRLTLWISLLVTAGRVAEAERAWRREAFPEDPADCVDLSAQSWREMEAVSEARARLLIAGRRWDEGRSLLRHLHSVSAELGLRTAEMRALALSVALEQQAGDTQASLRHLTEYLRLFAESPYAWPLVRDRAICARVLRTYVDLDADPPRRQAALSLLAMCGPDEASAPSLTERELEVLRLLEGRRDKEIAAELGLSAHGVRYHLRRSSPSSVPTTGRKPSAGHGTWA